MTALRDLRLRTALLASMGVVACLGCGDDTGLAKRYPVSGKVTYKGTPLEKGSINFVPETPDGRPAGGQIENGRYSLTTLAPGDGALPGKYKVTILAQEADTAELQSIAKGGQFHHDKAFLKANKTAKALVPSKYNLPETSGLTEEVKAQSNSINFDLVD